MSFQKASSDAEKQNEDGPGDLSLQDDSRQIRGFSWFLVVVAILSSMFIISLDGTIVANIAPTIVNKFHSVPLLPWLSVGFVVGSIVAVLPLGKIYQNYDAKWLYIISTLVFSAASALCGAAPNMNAMIVGRVILGLARTGTYIGVLTLLTVSTTKVERPMYLSLVGLVWSIGTLLGPVVGGAFEKINWRWAFYINLIIAGVFAPVYVFLLPSYNPRAGKQSPSEEQRKKFDIIGAILSSGAIMSLAMAINFGGVVYPWRSGQTIALFIVSLILLIAFALQQTFCWFVDESERMFPVQFLSNMEADLLFIAAACGNAAMFIPLFYLPVYFQFSRGDSALEAAVRMLPFITLLCATILSSGYLMGKLGYFQPWYLVGAALALVGHVLLSRVNITTSIAHIYGCEVLVAIGTGAFVQAGYATIHTAIPAKDAKYSISFMMLAQFVGIVFGLAVAGSIFVNGAIDGVHKILPQMTSQDIQSLISGTSSSLLKSLPPQLREQVLQKIIHSFNTLFIPAYVAAAVAFIVSLFFKRHRAFHSTNKAE